MKIIWNPFGRLFEVPLNSPYVHARTLRTTLIGKFFDTVDVYGGSGFDDIVKRKKQEDYQLFLGLLDYLTLGLLPLWESVWGSIAFLIKNECLAFIVKGIALMPRVLITAILTVASLPFIVIIHGLSLIKGAGLKREFEAIEVCYIENSDRAGIDVRKSYGSSSLIDRTKYWDMNLYDDLNKNYEACLQFASGSHDDFFLFFRSQKLKSNLTLGINLKVEAIARKNLTTLAELNMGNVANNSQIMAMLSSKTFVRTEQDMSVRRQELLAQDLELQKMRAKHGLPPICGDRESAIRDFDMQKKQTEFDEWSFRTQGTIYRR